MNIYLAGSIRDDNQMDIDWRHYVIDNVYVEGLNITWLNPLGGKTYTPLTRKWDMGGIAPVAGVIVPHDFWAVEHSDVILFNFQSLKEGYPTIGTLVEFGHATGLHPRPLLYSLIGSGYKGHDQPGVGNSLHPFLAYNSAAVFDNMDAMVMFLNSHLPVLTGVAPKFGGFRE